MRRNNCCTIHSWSLLINSITKKFREWENLRFQIQIFIADTVKNKSVILTARQEMITHTFKYRAGTLKIMRIINQMVVFKIYNLKLSHVITRITKQ